MPDDGLHNTRLEASRVGPRVTPGTTAYLGLGANLGDRLGNLRQALEILDSNSQG